MPARVALGLAALGLVLALVYRWQAPGCESAGASLGAARGWGWAATICTSGAMLAGLFCLATSRALVGVIALIAGAGGLLIASLTGLC